MILLSPFDWFPMPRPMASMQVFLNKALLLFVAPVPAALTWNWFQPARAMVLYVYLAIIGGCGLAFVFFEIRRVSRIVYFGSLAAFVLYLHLCGLYLWDSIRIQLPAQVMGNWQPGFRESVPLVMKYLDSYNKVIIDTPHAQPYIFFLFYGRYDPLRYVQELDLEKIGIPRKIYDFGKIEFKEVNDISQIEKGTMMVLWDGTAMFGKMPFDRVKVLGKVTTLDNYPLVEIVGVEK